MHANQIRIGVAAAFRRPGASAAARRAHTSKRGRVQAGGRRAPGPRSLAASRSLLQRAGPGGAAGARQARPGPAGGRDGEVRPEPPPRRAELGARRRRQRRRRQDKGDHVRREGGGRRRRRRRRARGGEGGCSPAAASGSPTAGPASPAAPWADGSLAHRRRRGAGWRRLRESLYFGPISPARGAGGAAAAGAPGGQHGGPPAPSGQSSRAGGRALRFGSAPAPRSRWRVPASPAASQLK